MATKTLSQIIGGSPPKTLTGRMMTGDTSIDASIFPGLSETAATSSATLTEVLNISGSGILQFLGLSAAGIGGTANPAKFKVVVDGVTVLDEASLSLNVTKCFCAVGGILIRGADNFLLFFEAVPFNTSLVVSQAGDGSDDVKTFYARYLN